MKAIIVTGGKQYTVAEGDVLYIEKLNAEVDSAVKFEQVLAVLDGENTKIGAPVVEGAAVEAKVVKNGKGKKIDIIRYKAKKGEKRHIGHRQPYTKVEITKIASQPSPDPLGLQTHLQNNAHWLRLRSSCGLSATWQHLESSAQDSHFTAPNRKMNGKAAYVSNLLRLR